MMSYTPYLLVISAAIFFAYESPYVGITFPEQQFLRENEGKWNMNNYYNPYHGFHQNGQNISNDAFTFLSTFINQYDIMAMYFFKSKGFGSETAKTFCTEQQPIVFRSPYLNYFCNYINGTIEGPNAPKTVVLPETLNNNNN
uniref:Uncharacterized protein n=1 Tax=Strongyloides venezuelensis TaxID=75913 RepID=A0A0K0FP06_STRVS